MDFPFLVDAKPWVQATAGLALLAALAIAARYLLQVALQQILGRLRDTQQIRWMQVLLHDTILRRLARIAPSLVVQLGVHAVPHLPERAANAIGNVAIALTVFHSIRVLTSLLDAAMESPFDADAAPQTRSIKSYLQLGKLLLYLVAAIVIVAALLDRSPLLLLSGMGALSAVLMLVFKDTILSFIAGVLLESNDMLRVGDWIEMPQVGADGDVIDIALHTVKVQNWDKTITTIPTWRLVAESYRNWRGMFSSGGRRIKRAVRIDASSIRFLEAADIAHLARIELLKDYLSEKHRDVELTNAERQSRLGELGRLPANRRRLTNLGTFRAYAEAYLRAHPGINQKMILMVRALDPTPEGAPLEVYCFTASTAWVVYEATQADIFDHLLAILPEFGLRLYQHPTGNDMREGLQRLEPQLDAHPTARSA